MFFSRWLYISMYSISLFIALKKMLRSLMHCCCLPQSQVHMIRHYGMAESIWTPKNKDEQGWFLLLMEEILLTSWYGTFSLFTGFSTSQVVVWDFWTINSRKCEALWGVLKVFTHPLRYDFFQTTRFFATFPNFHPFGRMPVQSITNGLWNITMAKTTTKN